MVYLLLCFVEGNLSGMIHNVVHLSFMPVVGKALKARLWRRGIGGKALKARLWR